MTREIRMEIEAAIKAQGRQRKWVAEQTGVSYVQFTRMMSGANAGSVKSWLKMLEALNLKLSATKKEQSP